MWSEEYEPVHNSKNIFGDLSLILWEQVSFLFTVEDV